MASTTGIKALRIAASPASSAAALCTRRFVPPPPLALVTSLRLNYRNAALTPARCNTITTRHLATGHTGTTFPQTDIAAHSTKVHKPVEELIKNDHRSFEELYERYQNTPGTTADAIEVKQAIVNEFVREVAQHSIAEETCVYNLIDKHISHNVGDHLRHDHLEIKNALYELDKAKVGDQGFDKLFERIVNLLKSHAKEEETEQLPALQQKIPSTKDRVDISAQFLRAKVIAPTRPHPSAPDKPAMLEMLAGLPVAPIDKLRDQTRSFAERRIPQE